MKKISPGQQAIIQLRKAGNETAQLQALQLCRSFSLAQPAFLKDFHDALLFALAYPFSEAVYKAAEAELLRIRELLQRNVLTILPGSMHY